MNRDRIQAMLDRLRLDNGLYVASPSQTYHYIWIRDVCYMAFSELLHDNGRYEQTYASLFDIFKRYEWKLRYHARHRPNAVYEYVHPRYDAVSGSELCAPWGNAQNDAIGVFLFGVAEGIRHGKQIVRDESDLHILNLLVEYLSTLEYWHDADNGMWEENREIHASSIGACVGGLLAIRNTVSVQWAIVEQGFAGLFHIIPSESAARPADLSLLSLIYPYQILPKNLGEMIIERVEKQLLREDGVIRYIGDQYYVEDGCEAEWCMGLPWLGLCHGYLGHDVQARAYLDWTERTMQKYGGLPELVLSVSRRPNENHPLGWGHALYLVLDEYLR